MSDQFQEKDGWSASPVERLVKFLFRCGGTERIVMFLEGYFDESGTHETASHLVVSGFLAPADQWIRFNTAWEQALADHSVPFFKAQWWNKHKEHFGGSGWDDKHRVGFMGRLLTTVKDIDPTPITCAIPMKDYEEIIVPGPVRNRIGSAYTLAAINCIALAGNWARANGYTEPIRYVFDEGHKNSVEFHLAHQKEWNDPEGRTRFLVGGLSFEDEKTLPPLQAADLIAYEMAQHLAGITDRHPLKEIVKLVSREALIERSTLIQMRNDHCPGNKYTE